MRANAARRAVTRHYSAKGGVRFEHGWETGDMAVDSQGRACVIVGPGLGGMPEVQFADGSTEFAFPHELTQSAAVQTHATEGGAI